MTGINYARLTLETAIQAKLGSAIVSLTSTFPSANYPLTVDLCESGRRPLPFQTSLLPFVVLSKR